MSRTGISADLGPASAAAVSVSLIQELRAKVRAIEQPAIKIGAAMDATSCRSWTLGLPEFDRVMGGLDGAGVHEIKPGLPAGTSSASAWGLAVGFGLRLAVRRLNILDQAHSQPIIWCWPRARASDIGQLYGPGLLSLGLDPARILCVETQRVSQTLWAMEEALKSGGVALVMGVLPQVDLTGARRLALAALTHATPCLLMTHGGRAATAATASRWRVGQQPSAPHLLDPRLPGGFAFTAIIERCRSNPAVSQSNPFTLEWCDETHRFRLPAALASGAARAPPDGTGRTIQSASRTADRAAS